MSKKIKHADPMKTRNGNPRLGPLNVEQLTKLMESTQRVKNKVKIAREIERKQKLEEK